MLKLGLLLLKNVERDRFRVLQVGLNEPIAAREQVLNFLPDLVGFVCFRVRDVQQQPGSAEVLGRLDAPRSA